MELALARAFYVYLFALCKNKQCSAVAAGQYIVFKMNTSLVSRWSNPPWGETKPGVTAACQESGPAVNSSRAPLKPGATAEEHDEQGGHQTQLWARLHPL